MRKLVNCIIIALILMMMNGCGIPLSILGIMFPNNKTIENAIEKDFEFFEDHFGVPNRDCVVSHLSMCFSNDSSSYCGKVRTDGFYYYPKEYSIKQMDTIRIDSKDPWGRNIYRIVFFPNKMYGGNFFFIDDARVGVGEWGLYDVFNDTIIIECMTRGSGNMASDGFRDTLIVKSPDTLILYSRTTICSEESTDGYYFHYYKGERGDEFYFMPYDRLPNPDESWIKKKKWFWCDEEEWRNYKTIRKKMDRSQ